MAIARSALYTEPPPADDDTAIVEAIAGICDSFESYGWRRVRAALRHEAQASAIREQGHRFGRRPADETP